MAVAVAGIALVASAASAIDEQEPNDEIGTANAIPASGSYQLNGETASGLDAADFFQINLTSASVVEIVATSSWGCGEPTCENLSVMRTNGSVLIDPFGGPMNGTEVYFSGLSGSTFYVRVAAGNPGGAYSLQVVVYPISYSAGQHVDITSANTSHATVAIAFGSTKSSVAPYDLFTEGLGVYYGYSLRLLILNQGPRDLTVVVPAGLFWIPEDRLYTSYVVTRTQSFTVPAWEWDAFDLIAVAQSPYGWVPGDPSHEGNPNYFLGPMAHGELEKITDETDAENYDFQAEQIAVWAEETGQTRSDIFNMGGSDRARDEAIVLLNAAGVRTGLNPTAPRSNFFLEGLMGSTWWIFCFMALFLGIPFLVGIAQVMRVVKLKNFHIDGGYGLQSAAYRREEDRRRRREARDMERDRRRQREHEEAVAERRRAAELGSIPVPVPPPPPAPAAAAVTPYARFMAFNATEKFDLDGLNSLDYNAVLQEAMTTKKIAETALAHTEEILKRLRTDIADPDIIDDILRDRMVIWYRSSPTFPNWIEESSHAWGGLVAESKAAGGRLRTPLEKRLSGLELACGTRNAWFKPKPKDDAPRGKKGMAAPPLDAPKLKAAVVQAVLDDLGALPRNPQGASHPLPMLSELAAKLTPQRVNQALAETFKADIRGPYVVLHPSRYPDCGVTAIRPPAAGTRAGAMAYEITMAAPPGMQQVIMQPAGDGTGPAQGVAPAGTAAFVDVSSAVWEKDQVTQQDWVAVINELQRQRSRMDPPPTSYRKLPAYFTLRQALVADDGARRAFLGVKWRGKPVGLPILVQLLVDRQLQTEYDTDREYFEAELGDLERGDPQYQPADGKWKLPGGVEVTRAISADGQVSYKL